MKTFKFNLQKFNPLIVIFPILLPFIYIIFFSTLTGLFDNFLLLVFKIFNLPYERYSSITSFTSGLPFLWFFFCPIYFFMAYFFYPLQKKWLKNINLNKVSNSLFFIWWFFSGLLITVLVSFFLYKAID